MRDIAQIFAVEECIGLVGDAEGYPVEFGLSFDDLLVDELIEEFEIAPRSVSQRDTHLIAHLVAPGSVPTFTQRTCPVRRKFSLGVLSSANDAVDFVAFLEAIPTPVEERSIEKPTLFRSLRPNRMLVTSNKATFGSCLRCHVYDL